MTLMLESAADGPSPDTREGPRAMGRRGGRGETGAGRRRGRVRGAGDALHRPADGISHAPGAGGRRGPRTGGFLEGAREPGEPEGTGGVPRMALRDRAEPRAGRALAPPAAPGA